MGGGLATATGPIVRVTVRDAQRAYADSGIEPDFDNLWTGDGKGNIASAMPIVALAARRKWHHAPVVFLLLNSGLAAVGEGLGLCPSYCEGYRAGWFGDLIDQRIEIATECALSVGYRDGLMARLAFHQLEKRP